MARVTQQDFQRLLEFRVALREFQRWSEDQADAAALTHVQHQLLVAVKGHPGDQRAGLVERIPDKYDGRVVRVHLTKAGDRILQRLTKAHLSRLHELAAVLDDLVTRHETEAARTFQHGRPMHDLPGDGHRRATAGGGFPGRLSRR